MKNLIDQTQIEVVFFHFYHFFDDSFFFFFQIQPKMTRHGKKKYMF